MVAVGVVQVPVDQVVHVVAVRYGLVTAAGSVPMARLVGVARVIGRAVGGIRAADGELMLVHVVRVGVVEMPIVQVVDVAIVPDCLVAAALPVDVIVALVLVAGHDRSPVLDVPVTA